MKLHHILLVTSLSVIFATGWMRQLNAAEAKGDNITITLDKPGNVSAAIYDKDGRMVRELARGLPMQAGSHQFAWDGLDRSGAPLPAGDYTWNLLLNSGLLAKFLGMFGITPVEAPYDPWVGNNDGPSAVAWD